MKYFWIALTAIIWSVISLMVAFVVHNPLISVIIVGLAYAFYEDRKNKARGRKK